MTSASDAVAALRRAAGRLGAVLESIIASPWIWGGSLLIGLTLSYMEIRAPEVERTIAPEMLANVEQRAFIVRVPDALPYVIRGNTSGTRVRELTLFEDGFPLGPRDTPHQEIRAKGGGTYSHWGDVLYFSTTDGSDFRSNGHIYSYRAPMRLHPILRRAGYAALALALLGIAAFSLRRGSAAAARETTWDKARRYVGILAIASGSVGLGYLSLVLMITGPRQGVIDAATISAQRGQAYVSRIEPAVKWPLKAAAAPGLLDPGTDLTLAEDGTPLGPMDTDPRVLARSGGGRYALFADKVVFSTTDGSDPHTNGRAYSWQMPLEVEPAAWNLALFMLLVGFLLAGRKAPPQLATWLLDVSSNRSARNATLQALVVCFVCAVAVGLVVHRWNWGPSALLGFKGWLPISDAKGYFNCSVVLAGTPGLEKSPVGLDWCARRVLYLTALGASLGVSGWRPQAVLIFQALAIGGALAAFALTVARAYGRLAAFLAFAGLLIFAYEVALGNFMTEAIGLPLGLLGMSLLIVFAFQQQRLGVLYAGLAFVSVGMFARMGAVLVLPMLGLWACWLLFRSRRAQWLGASLGAIAALCTGALLQVLVVAGLDLDAANTGGNYSTVLYGLSTGSRDWSEAYRDLAPVFQSATSETAAFAQVYASALANIRANPGVFVSSLAAGFMTFLSGPFLIGALIKINPLLMALCACGVL
jgi:hypothetical protein